MIKLKDLITELWNSNLWNSNLDDTHLWNSNIDKSDIWNPGVSSCHSDESPDSEMNFGNLNEIMGAKNFWVLPNGNIEEVDDHLNWFTDNVESEFYHDEDGFTTKADGSICEPEDVYEVASKMGYIRMLKEPGDKNPLTVDVEPSHPPTNLQTRNIRDFAIEHRWKLRGIRSLEGDV